MDDGPGLLVRAPSLEERWLQSQTRRASSRLLTAAISTLVFHLVLIVGTGWLDQYRRIRATAEQEVPVEVVDEVPQPKPQQTAQDVATAAPQPQLPQPESPPKPEPQQKPSAQQQTAADLPKPVEPEVSRGDVAQPPAEKPDAAKPPTEPDAAAQQAAGLEVPPPPSDETPVEDEKEPPNPSEQEAATAEFRIVPKTFRGAALPGAPRETEDSYKSRVFGMLERAKQNPASARARGARGSALVNFLLDRAGNLVNVSLVRSTGDRELDVEALALVRRAAPFPKPPVGVLLSFTPIIFFGEDDAR